MVRPSTAPLDADDFFRAIFEHASALGEKDLTLALAMGEELGVDTPVARYALDTIAAALGVPHEKGQPS